jgi:hypothetical protein
LWRWKKKQKTAFSTAPSGRNSQGAGPDIPLLELHLRRPGYERFPTPEKIPVKGFSIHLHHAGEGNSCFLQYHRNALSWWLFIPGHIIEFIGVFILIAGRVIVSLPGRTLELTVAAVR